MTLSKLIKGREIEIAVHSRSVNCKNLQDFVENSEIGQKWIDFENKTTHFKIQDEEENVIVFHFKDGKPEVSN